MLSVKVWNAKGNLIKDERVEDDAGEEGLEFYAHQLLHTNDADRVEVSNGHVTIERSRDKGGE